VSREDYELEQVLRDAIALISIVIVARKSD
jgi:hypothetical protein